jgi:hypothetical protein
MITLETFVSETLKEIINGVVAAQEHAKTKGAMVNAWGMSRDDQGIVHFNHRDEALRDAQDVHFDIAVTATEGTETKGGVGVIVGVLGLGSQGQTEREKSVVSRISFDVPILLPIQKG